MSEPRAAKVDRSRPPAPEPRQPFRFPAFEVTRLANGLRLLVARLESLPLVSLEVVVPAGAQHDPPGLSGLAALHAGLLDEGTARRGALEIAAAVEGLGGSLSSGADWDAAYLSAGLLAEHLGPGLELLAEIACSPSFPDAEIERLRQQRLAEILREKDQPSLLAHRAFCAAVYAGSAYGEPLPGTEAGVTAIGRDDLAAFHERHVPATGSTLVAVGALDPEELAGLAEEAFRHWPERAGCGDPTLEPATLERTLVRIVDRPEAAQTQLQIGHAGPPRRHPDRHALMVLNAILGGKFTSRINLNLRERHGYTYGASSHFVGRLGPGPFNVRAAVATEVAGAAVGEVLSELQRICREPVAPAELEETHSYLLGVFPYTLQTVSGVARRLEDLAVYGLPEDYYDDYPAVLGRIGRDQVLEAARRHLRPEALVITAVGPAEALRAQLEGFGPVEVTAP